MAAAKKKPPIEQRDDFDAHQFQVMADAAYQVPRTARGGARDLTSADDKIIASGSDEGERISSGRELPKSDITHRPEPGPAPRFPTLVESQERRRYVEPQPAQQWDTVYREPERRVAPAKKEGARVRHGSDVKFHEPEVPRDVKFEFSEEPAGDPRFKFIEALNGPPPQGEIPGVEQRGEDPRWRIVNGKRFIV
jgi:hypothetical protein